MTFESNTRETTRRIRELLAAILTDAVVRRAFRRTPDRAVEQYGLLVPPPPESLETRTVGVSVSLNDEDLLGRRWHDQPSADITQWITGGDVDAGMLLCLQGARPMALMHAPEDRAEDLARWLRGWGFIALLGPFAFTPKYDRVRGCFSDVTNAVWPARAGSGGWRTLLLSVNRDMAVASWLALLFGWDRWLGVLLGYPPCCAAAFKLRWDRARQLIGGDVARMLLAEMGLNVLEGSIPSESKTALPWFVNSFPRVLGAAVPLHFACGVQCVETARLTPWHLQILWKVDPERARRTRDLLTAPLVVGMQGEVICLVNGSITDKDRVTYDPAEVSASFPNGTLAMWIQQRNNATAGELAQRGAMLLPVSAPE